MMVSTAVEDFRYRVMEAMREGNLSSAGRLFGKMVVPLEPLQWEPYFPIFKEMLLVTGESFMYKGYPAFLREVWKLHPAQVLQFENTFLGRYCLLPEEELIESFCGRLKDTGVDINGNVFLTNYRLITTGFRKTPWQGQGLLVGWLFDHVEKTIQQTLSRDFSQFVRFGFIVPYLNNYKLDLLKDRVTYKVNVSYERRAKVKVRKRKVVIRVQKLRSQKASEFKVYQKEILEQLYSRLGQEGLQT